MENENVICRHCGEEINIDGAIEHEGHYYCDSCYHDRFVECTDCGYLMDTEEVDTYTNDNDRTICENCYYENYNNCEFCGETIHTDNTYWIDDTCMCEYCYNERAGYCDSCDTHTWEENINYVEEEDSYMCDTCYHEYQNNHRHSIHSYHNSHNRELQFHKCDNEDTPPYYVGFELEIEPKDYYDRNENSALDLIYDNLNATCEHDSSLNSGGFEIITEPQTPNYIMENKDKLKLVLEGLQQNGYISHDTNRCGLHFHISRLSDRDKDRERTKRIWFIMETFKEQMIKFSRRDRNSSNQMHYGSTFISDTYWFKSEDIDDKELKSLYYIDKKQSDYSRDRYLVLNNTNTNTIEFRLMRGTLNYDTFMASFELVNNITTLCGDLSIPIEEITWEKLTETEYARKYCEDREIFTEISPIDYSLQIINRELKRQEICEKVKKLLNIVGRELLDTIKIDKSTFENLQELSTRFYSDYDRVSNINRLLNNLTYFSTNIENYSWNGIKSNIEELINNTYYVGNDKTKNKLRELLEMGEM